MAELIIKTSTHGPDPAWQHQDIIDAMNDLRIYDLHAQHICHKNLIGFSPNGLRPSDSLTEIYLSSVKPYKFERISEKEVKRTTLATLHEDILSDKPDAKGQAIDVIIYLYGDVDNPGRLADPKHTIFGTTGNEVWYGGTSTITAVAVNNIWSEIEARTLLRKVDHGLFPWGREDMKNHLVITVDDFDNSARNELESSLYDNAIPPHLEKRRKNKVAWKALSGLTAQNITDIQTPGLAVDIRENYSFILSQIIIPK
jgi:hypothetical protein